MVALSEAYKATPILRHHTEPLDFGAALSELPETHDWTVAGKIPDGEFSGDRSSPPTIDLSSQDTAELMVRACEEWGAFLLTGHGVEAGPVEAETRRLFGLSAERKRRALRAPGGATGYGVARISPFFSKHMWHEGFTVMGSPEEHAKELWPAGYDRFCEVMEDFQSQMKQLSEKILKLLVKHLNIPEQDLNWLITDPHPHRSGPCTALQLNSYPKCPDPTRAMGLAPHTDTFLITIVHQTAPGLELLSDGAWATVPPVNGAMVVNVGDLLHVLSGGRLKSVVHRVAVNRACQRYSVAYFYGPPLDFTVSPAPVSAPATEVLPRYRSVTVKEYVEMRAKHLDKSLSLIKIN